MIGDYMLDPPNDPPHVECPDCEGTGILAVGEAGDLECPACDGDGERYLTTEEIHERELDAAEEKAERRREDW